MNLLTGFLFSFSLLAAVLSFFNYRRSTQIRAGADAMYNRANAVHKKANQAYEEATQIKRQAEQAFAKANRFLTYQTMN